MIKLFKQLVGRETAQELNDLLTLADASLLEATQRLQAENDRYGEALLEARSDADRDRAEKALATHRSNVSQLEAARNALERRLAEARELEAQTVLQHRWADCEEKLAARHAAFERVTQAAQDYARALVAAEQAAIAVWEATPIRQATSPGGLPLTFSAEWGAMKGIGHYELDVALSALDVSPWNGNTDSEFLAAVAKRQSLAEQSRTSAEYLLQHRAHPTPTLPSAA